MKLHYENPVFMVLQTSINHMMLYITIVRGRVSKIQDILRKQTGLITICKEILHQPQILITNIPADKNHDGGAIIQLTGVVCRYETHVPYPKYNHILNGGDFLTVPDVLHISLFTEIQ